MDDTRRLADLARVVRWLPPATAVGGFVAYGVARGWSVPDAFIWALAGVASANVVVAVLGVAAAVRLVEAARRGRPELVPVGPRGRFALLSAGELRTIVEADLHEPTFGIARADYLAARRAQNLVGPTMLVLTVVFLASAVVSVAQAG